MAKQNSNDQRTQVSQPQPDQPLTQLEGFSCPSLIPIAVLLDGECPNPLDRTSLAGVSSVASITRMRNGGPDENGPDVRVVRKDGSFFDICGAPIAFKYKLDPIEVRLERHEIVTLAHQLWNAERGADMDAATQEQIDINRRRAVRHNQKAEVTAIMDELRNRQKKLDLIKSLDDPEPETGDLNPAVSEQVGVAAEILA